MLMSFKYGQEFASDREFVDAELQALTPNDIYQYFKFRVYGDSRISPIKLIFIDHNWVKHKKKTTEAQISR